MQELKLFDSIKKKVMWQKIVIVTIQYAKHVLK